MVTKCFRGLAAGSLVCVAAAMPAFAEDADLAAMRAEMAQMRAELAQLKATSGESWMDEAREQEMRALVEEVLADAQSRSAFQEGGLGAGHDGKKFYLEGAGFRLNVGGQLQFRFNNNWSDDRSAEGEHLHGFEIRRAKLSFDGHIADPKIGYYVVLSADRGDGDVKLEDAIISYKFDNGIKVKAGKMKLPFLAEELLSSKRQLAVDRSLSTEFFTLNRAEQVQVEVPIEDKAKLYFAYSDGANTESSTATTNTTEYAFTGRGVYLVDGEWSQGKDLVAYEDDFALLVGGAVHFEKQEISGEELTAWTADAVLKQGNLAVMAAVIGASGDVDNRDQLGFLVQAGYNVTKELQPFLRYDYIDDDTADELNAITAGFNYFLKKHNAKFTADVVYIIEPENPSAIEGLNGGEFSSGLGLSSSGLSGDEDQVALRAQFQLLF